MVFCVCLDRVIFTAAPVIGWLYLEALLYCISVGIRQWQLDNGLALLLPVTKQLPVIWVDSGPKTVGKSLRAHIYFIPAYRRCYSSEISVFIKGKQHPPPTSLILTLLFVFL